MIEVEVGVAGWSPHDWAGLAKNAVVEAFRASPHGALIQAAVAIEISIRLTTDDEVQTLNRQFRDQDKPTNVLSFPMVQPDLIEMLANTDDGEVLLGDIVLALGTCTREAQEKHVTLEDHAAHLIVHGTLHLLGQDHMTDAEAEGMEAIERAAMAAMGLHNPYQDSETPE